MRHESSASSPGPAVRPRAADGRAASALLFRRPLLFRISLPLPMPLSLRMRTLCRNTRVEKQAVVLDGALLTERFRLADPSSMQDKGVRSPRPALHRYRGA